MCHMVRKDSLESFVERTGTSWLCSMTAMLAIRDTSLTFDLDITIPGIFREPSAAIYVVNPGYLGECRK